MEKYLKIIDDTILVFEQKHPKCAEFAKKKIPKIKKETLDAIKRYQKDIDVLGINEITSTLELYLSSAKEVYNAGIDYLQPHNGNDYKSAADNILIGMLEIKWITSFLNEARNLIEPLKIEQTPQHTGNESYFLDVAKVIKSHSQFDGFLFESLPFPDYLSIFDLNATPKEIKFKDRKKIQFIYFLSRIVDKDLHQIVNARIAERFGINYYLQDKNKHNPKPDLINKVNLILK